MAAVLGIRPLLLMSWGSDVLVDAEQDDFWHWLTCYTLERSDMMLCDCYAVCSSVQKLMKYPTERIVMFPWGVDLKQFSSASTPSELRRQLGWDDYFVLLSTRSWEPLYDIETLLQSFTRAYQRCQNLRLILVGSGTRATDINRIIVDNNLQNAIHMPGRVNYTHLPAYFRAADLYISCSHSDGTSVSLLEAMAAELPVCVSDIPGNREWVQAGVNGWLVPVGDVSGFAKAISDAFYKTGNMRQMGMNNRKVAESRADWDSNFRLLERSYTTSWDNLLSITFKLLKTSGDWGNRYEQQHGGDHSGAHGIYQTARKNPN